MAESNEAPQTSDLSPPFLEVICSSSGKTRRFAPGTKAGFALNLINNKLDVDGGAPLALYIEAFKHGEEPIIFGPSSVLISYGNGWKLHTVLDSQGVNKGEFAQASYPSHSKKRVSEPVINSVYVGKILLAFVFIFMLGGIFTLALENLPSLMLFINSSL